MSAATEQRRHAPPATPPARLGESSTGPARWVLAAAVWAAVMGASLGLAGVLENFSWFPRAGVVVALTLLPPALLRSRGALAPFAPLGAVAGWLTGLTLMFFPGTALLGFLPTSRTVQAALELGGEASAVIMGTVAPAPAVPSMAFALAAGLGFAAVLIDTIAITLAVPAAGSLGIILILLPAALMTKSGVGTLGFMAAATGFLVLLGCCSWYAPGGKLRPGATTAPSGALVRGAALGGAVVLLMALLPAAIPGFTQGSFPQGARLGGDGGPTRLDPMIALGSNLREQSSRINLSYLSNTNTAQYLRLSTLEDFTGQSWAPSPLPVQLSSELSDLAPAPAPNPVVPRQEIITEVTSRGLDSEWLPAPQYPVEVTDLDGRWLWNPATATLAGQDASTREQSYTVRSEMPRLSPQLLDAARLPPRRELDPIFTTLPNDVPELLGATAQELGGTLPTPYAKAMALQDYLRSDQFSYSLDTPAQEGYDGSGMGVLNDFLERKSGYCVHFSAAMAVMARELGIPSRIAVGYAPGAANLEVAERGGVTLFGYQASGRDAHAWPELYFESLGWVPFEPTPSRGAVPDYAQAESAPAADPQNVPLPEQSTPAPTTAAATPTATTAGASPAPGTGSSPWPGRLALGLPALAVLAVPALVRTGSRRRTLARIRRGGAAGTGDAAAMLAWRELMATAADYGHAGDPARTPALEAAALARRFGPAAPGGLTQLQHAYEEAVFGGAASVQGREDLAAAVESLTARLRSRATLWQRLRAAVAPASLFRR
ncbi:transglutaminaseTgpA domain-containing protein [Specibacter sp. NPDC057265]|uniref:transglutaminase family protein n=1 Tax=Specibacter sp. NPDC057265 TaxID=3346075 RepID=UPI00362C3B2F